jgi:hypothetical protein
MSITREVLLNQKELVDRWRNVVTPKTLANWRWGGVGPEFIKVGTRVLYRLEDVEKFEKRKGVNTI